MKSKKGNRSAILFLFLFFSLVSFAQQDTTLIRTVVVEQEYNPDVLDASKINILPKVEEPQVDKKDIEYSYQSIPVNSYGKYEELQPFTQKDAPTAAKRGYVRLGYGNRGNVDAKFNYLYDISSRDQLGINFSLDGMNGNLNQIPHSYSSMEGEKWKSRYYRTYIGADYLHSFQHVELNIGGKYNSDVFNYNDFIAQYFFSTDKQHHTKGQATVGINSKGNEVPLYFKLQTNYLYFNKKYWWEENQPETEQILYTNLELLGEISDDQKIGIKGDMNNIFYSSLFTDYTTVGVTPYYLYEGEPWRVMLGAQLDFAFGYGKSFQVAPKVSAQYNFAESYLIYLEADGGRQLNNYRQLETLSPYWTPMFDENIKNTYSPFNGKIGFKASPTTGLWFNLFGGYEIKKDDLCLIYNKFYTTDTKAFYVGGEILYNFKDVVNLSLLANYYDWSNRKDEDGINDEFVFLMRPKFDFKADLDFKIKSQFLINLGYHYLHRPKSTFYETDQTGGAWEDKDHVLDVNNLNLGITYKLYKDLSIYGKVNNLLNKKNEYYYGYAGQKLNFLVGASYSF